MAAVYNTAQPYIASFVILRRANTIAFVLRSNTGWMDGHYGLPSGKVEKNESFTAAAVREAKEEIGVTIALDDLTHALTIHRTSTEKMDWIDVFFEVKTWEGEPYNAEPTVHGELAWLDIDNLPENIVPAVRFGLEKIAAGQIYAEYGWQPGQV
jgi:8-oxo-dGTP diphosphatase